MYSGYLKFGAIIKNYVYNILVYAFGKLAYLLRRKFLQRMLVDQGKCTFYTVMPLD